MKKDPKSLIKKSIKSVLVSTPIPFAASLVQWWSDMDFDSQSEAIERLENNTNRLQNPILYSHPKAKDALELLFKKIEQTKKTYSGYE